MLWKKIDRKMQEKGWTIYRLAKRADVEPTVLYYLRDGKSKDLMFDTIKKIAVAFNCSTDDFR
ncbi:helix-turn-helix domain-containing protein [Streptococcus thoraltensis]|uniref:helix-turn-helix domain-containing protein n=1 Tax=Streptococcus thoraltensis TaxID=55085 RepID=UPI001F55BA7C|nr:helix-turn-helix transcriptional regulator [Streptococcus thoraltensis]